MEPAKKLSPVIIALIVIVLVGAGTTAVVVASQSKNKTASADTSTAADTQSDTSTTSTDTSATYKDGTYTETGNYISPGGAESIDVTVTLASNIITSATVTGNATGESKEHQDDFIAAYKSSVVGKNINTVKLSRVGGASLTSNGFNTALTQIKADAKA